LESSRLRLRLLSPRAIAGAVVVVALGAIGFLPLFGGPGYEQSLASGLVVPSVAAVATAVEVSASPLAPLACVARGIDLGARLAALAFATALLHGLRAGMCDLSGGAVFFALTAGFGALMGGAWGALAGEASRGLRRRRLACVLLALAGPIAGIAVSLARFFGSPMIFAFDPFFGFFSGTLYDTVVDERVELSTYRAGSLALLAGLALVASSLTRTERGALALRGAPRSGEIARLLLGGCALAAALAVAAEGPRLGHWQTADSIARALGARSAGPRCDVVYPDSLRADQAALLVRDCEEELAADEQRLGARLDGRLTAYVFRDAAQKRTLMGAAQTSIAKPWRREVYVQLASYPHPILGHEIAHVVAGSFGHGPLRIAGAVGGLWPNPGLIEGVAVAASPDDDQLTEAQWARAMLDLGILPPVDRLFSLGFLGENAAKSYTIAGAFVTWVLEGWGAGAVRDWYGGGSIERLTGKTWDQLDAAFRRSLLELPMPAGASDYARARFERPSVWSRRCPHVVDALVRDGDHCRDDHRFASASAAYDAALERDPHDAHARYERARIDLRYGDQRRGRDELSRMASDAEVSRTWRDRADEALADDDLARGRDREAAEAYGALAARTLDEDVRRTADIKRRAASDPVSRGVIVDLLVGDPGRPVDPWLGAFSLGAWAEGSPGGLSLYLAGKNLTLHESYARAAEELDRALDAAASAGDMPAPVARELLRQRAVCACALGDRAALERTRARAEAPDSPFVDASGGGGTARKEWLLRLMARCAPAGR